MVERRFGRFIIQPGRRQLLIDGEPAKIGSRAFDLLMALIERRQRVVAKDELLDLVWPGVTVEESNLQVHVLALRKLLGPDAITTIPGRGYQFTAPLPDQPTPISAAEPLTVKKAGPERLAGSRTTRLLSFRGDSRRARPLIAASVCGFILAGGAIYFLWATPPAPVAPSASTPLKSGHLSIVVLPFTSLSSDPAQDYFADGVTENLTTDLSRVRDSFVIARNTAFTYKDKKIDAKEIGKELGVRYVLEGAVQRDLNRVRVNAQLVDAESGAHLWADRFDEDVADLFELQDQVVARLGNALGFELVKAEAARSARVKSPDAIDLAMRGWAIMWQSYPQPAEEKRKSHYAALALFDQALKIDPNNGDALAGAAFSYMALYAFGEETGEADLDTKIIGQADRAIAAAPENVRAYVAKSTFLTVTNRATEALRTADSGLAINSNYAPLLDARALAETALGRFEQAKSDAQQAMLLSPRDAELASRLGALGLAELGLGHFDAAIADFQKSIDEGNRSFIPYVTSAAA